MAEARYLKRTLGNCLAEGMAEVAAKRPADPVEYLALWLLNYKKNAKRRAEEGPIPVVRQLVLVEEEKKEDEPPSSDVPPVAEPVGTTEPGAQSSAVRAPTEPQPPSMPRIEEEEENSN